MEKNTENKPNLIIAGDSIFAGIEEDQNSEIKNAVVIEFESKEQMKSYIRSGEISFDFMRMRGSINGQ